jgi:hypothetical protein
LYVYIQWKTIWVRIITAGNIGFAIWWLMNNG